MIIFPRVEPRRVLSLLPIQEVVRGHSLLHIQEVVRGLSLLHIQEVVRALSLLPIQEVVRGLSLLPIQEVVRGLSLLPIQDRPTSSFGRPGSSLDTVSNMDMATYRIDRVPSSLEIGTSNLDRGSSSSLDEDQLPTENLAWLSEFCSTDELEKLDVDKRWAAWDRSAQESKLTA